MVYDCLSGLFKGKALTVMVVLLTVLPPFLVVVLVVVVAYWPPFYFELVPVTFVLLSPSISVVAVVDFVLIYNI